MSGIVTTERDGAVLVIGVNRPEKANAWDADVIRGVAQAYTDLAGDAGLRAGVVFGHGKHFTGGLDLAAVAPVLAAGGGDRVLPPELCDPWDFTGEPCPKPIVLAVHGRCNTLGIELALASQTTIAAEDTVFAQLEVARGIIPLGGATFRLPLRLGGRGTKWLLTAETFDASDALDAGLVQEVVPAGEQLGRAREVAHEIAANAPLAVQAALAQARAAERAIRDAAAGHLAGAVPDLFRSQDAAEAVAAMMEKRAPEFVGA